MSSKPVLGREFEYNEMHKALVGVSRLGELRQSINWEVSLGQGGDDADGLLALLNGTIAEINDQITEAINRAAGYRSENDLN